MKSLILNDFLPKKKTAFTLAEVLITLGIIGIVAALTIPTLITNIQKKQTVTKLQKAISVINQAYRMAYDEVGEATPEEAHNMGTDAYFEKYWAPYLKTAHICKTYSDCGYKSIMPFYYRDGENSTTSVTGYRTTFYTPDGFLYIIFVAIGNGQPDTYVPYKEIWVDINGGKAPNKFGYDVFKLERNVDTIKGGYVGPVCRACSRSDVNHNCLTKGGYCAAKIRRDGWQIKDDYGWGK